MASFPVIGFGISIFILFLNYYILRYYPQFSLTILFFSLSVLSGFMYVYESFSLFFTLWVISTLILPAIIFLDVFKVATDGFKKISEMNI
jgi:hypothetical protein